MSKTRVLFVCLGNICRSPLAEAIFKHKIREKRLDTVFEADSCGTSNYHIGDPPDHRTVRNANKNGIKIDHLGRQLTEKDLATFDYVLAMDDSNYHAIFRLKDARVHTDKIFMMRQFDSESQGGNVPDPYYGGDRGFQEVFEILDRSMDGFIEYLQQNRLGKTG